MRQGIETIVNHPQGVAQILLTALSSRQIGKVGCDARVVRGAIVFIEANALDGKCKFIAHFSLTS
ncbi:hypothetical protein D3C80_1893450 [compost metagenome]